VVNFEKVCALCLTLGLALGSFASALAGPASGVLYETFDGRQIAALNLSNPSAGLAFRFSSASNVAVGGDFVYFQDDTRIFKANATLSGVTQIHNNGVAPTDIAVNVAAGVLYESFDGRLIAALNLANPSLGLRLLAGNYSNISVSAGKVYFQSGVDIFVADADLSNVSLLHRNGVAPTDFAVDADNNVYYQTFGNRVVAIELTNPSRLLGLKSGNFTNLAVGDGNVYVQEGTQIWRSDRALSTMTLLHTNGAAPTDIAVMPPPPALPPAVAAPEPAGLGLFAMGSAMAGWLRMRRARRAG
jgi:hypothetical protein